MELCQLRAQPFRGGIGVQPQPLVGTRTNCPQDCGGWRVGIFVRVELDQSLDLRLFARDIFVQIAHQRPNQGFRPGSHFVFSIRMRAEDPCASSPSTSAKVESASSDFLSEAREYSTTLVRRWN